MACEGLEFLGVEVNPALNDSAIGRDMVISTGGARVRVLVVPTDEEQMIAIDTLAVAQAGGHFVNA